MSKIIQFPGSKKSEDSKSLSNKDEAGFTYKYSQPDSYHFSLDSIELAKQVSQVVKVDSNSRILDLCAGSGVIGFELAFHRPELRNIDFVDVQSEWQPFFEENLKITGRSPNQFRYHFINYQDFNLDESVKYDLIVCNPPYFFSEQGKLSPDHFRNRCKFYLDSDFDNLVSCILRSLSPSGEAFVLIRDLLDHKIDLLDHLRKLLGKNYQLEIFADVRGTDCIRVYQR